MSMASLFFYNQLKKLGLIEDDIKQEESPVEEDLEEETDDD
jgi:hypothetical protein